MRSLISISLKLRPLGPLLIFYQCSARVITSLLRFSGCFCQLYVRHWVVAFCVCTVQCCLVGAERIVFTYLLRSSPLQWTISNLWLASTIVPLLLLLSVVMYHCPLFSYVRLTPFRAALLLPLGGGEPPGRAFAQSSDLASSFKI